MLSVEQLPALNALLNTTATVLLFLGWRAVRGGRPMVHRNYMIAALAVSAMFLTSYLVYHYNTTAMNRYPGQGWDRYLYLFILFTHIPLAIIIVPGCLAAVWHAARGNFERHVRVTRWLWPTWMYVSVTGVLIYVMLYLLPHSF